MARVGALEAPRLRTRPSRRLWRNRPCFRRTSSCLRAIQRHVGRQAVVEADAADATDRTALARRDKRQGLPDQRRVDGGIADSLERNRAVPRGLHLSEACRFVTDRYRRTSAAHGVEKPATIFTRSA